jgi:type VI secretion system secreted protein VgrG
MEIRSTCLIVAVLCARSVYADVVPINLGTAGSYAVLAGSTVTNTGSTSLEGNLGVSPGTAITGLLPAMVTGAVHAGDAAALQAESDLTSAYNFAAAETCGTNLTGKDLGGLTLTPGVYCFSSSAQLTGKLTLDAGGNPNALYLFQIGSTLTTAANSSVFFSNGDQGVNVDWQVGSSGTLGTGTKFAGNIMALTSITLDTGAQIETGSALARNGAVTLDTNIINEAPLTTTPEPSFLGIIALILGITACRFFWIRSGRQKSAAAIARG